MLSHITLQPCGHCVVVQGADTVSVCAVVTEQDPSMLPFFLSRNLGEMFGQRAVEFASMNSVIQ